jgi:pimeloyl-ACP methyl ester carboxylesterase
MERAINGHPTWIEDRGGDGPPVLLLHGGLGDSRMLLDGVGAAVGGDHRIVAFDRRGHGRTADTEAPFHYADMGEETVGVLKEVVGGPAHLIGFSDGGIIGLLVALDRPDLVRSLVLIGTNYHHDGIAPIDFDPESPVLAMIAAAYAELSPDGAVHFETVLEKTMALFETEPTLTLEDVARIGCPTLVLVGDDDAVTLDHTCSLFETLPNGQLAVVPAASHMVLLERPALVNQLVTEFLTSGGSAQTLMPVRRAAAAAG